VNTYEVRLQLSGGGTVLCEVENTTETLAPYKAITELKKLGYDRYLPMYPEKFAKVCKKII
jgi:hypothetical protein